MNNIDASIINADWTKTVWDLPSNIDYYEFRYGKNLGSYVERLMLLPVADVMPNDLKAEFARRFPAAFESKTYYLDPETKTRYVRDADYWGVPYGTPITPGMKPQGQMVLPGMPKLPISEVANPQRLEQFRVRVRGGFPGSYQDGVDDEKSIEEIRMEYRRYEYLLEKFKRWWWNVDIDEQEEEGARGDAYRDFKRVKNALYEEYGIVPSELDTRDPELLDDPVRSALVAGDWLYFGACRDIRNSAYSMLGFDESDREADPHAFGGDPGWGGANREAKAPDALAYGILKEMMRADKTEIPVYRGIDLQGWDAEDFIADLRREDTFDLPVASFVGNEEGARSFGTDVIFKLEKGARHIRGSYMGVPEKTLFELEESGEWKDMDDFADYIEYSEIVSGGRFKVVRVKQEDATFIVTIRQVGVYNPDNGLLQKAARKRWKWAFLFDNSLMSLHLAQDGKARENIKSMLIRGTIEEKGVRRVRDPEYWGRPYGTIITPGMKPVGPKAIGTGAKPPSVTPSTTKKPKVSKPKRKPASKTFREIDPREWANKKSEEIADKLRARGLNIPSTEQFVLVPKRVFQKGNVTVADFYGIPEVQLEKIIRATDRLTNDDPIENGLSVLIRDLSPAEDPDDATGAFTVPGKDPLIVLPPKTASATSPFVGMMASSIYTDVVDYVMAHEYGHARGPADPQDLPEPDEHLYMSRYGRTSPKEAYAEAYAEWVHGDVENPTVAWHAETYGWKRKKESGMPKNIQILIDGWPMGEKYPSTGWIPPLDDVTLPDGREIHIITAGDSPGAGMYNGSYYIYDKNSGELMGRLDYQSANGMSTRIAMIEVEPKYRRQGIASVLLARLVADFPGEIDPGMTTPAGNAWWREVSKYLKPEEAPKPEPVGDTIYEYDEINARMNRYAIDDGRIADLRQEAKNPSLLKANLAERLEDLMQDVSTDELVSVAFYDEVLADSDLIRKAQRRFAVTGTLYDYEQWLKAQSLVFDKNKSEEQIVKEIEEKLADFKYKEFYVRVTDDGDVIVEEKKYLDGNQDILGREPYPVGSAEAELFVRQNAVSKLIFTWAATSNDNNPLSLAMQEAVREEFGLEDTADWELQSGSTADLRAGDLYTNHSKMLRKFARAQYSETQRIFKEINVGGVTLYRGMAVPYDSPVAFAAINRVGTQVKSRPISSWSSKPGIARMFAKDQAELPTQTSVVFMRTVKAEEIFSTPLSGFGCWNEKEFVVLGGVSDVDIRSADWADLDDWMDQNV